MTKTMLKNKQENEKTDEILGEQESEQNEMNSVTQDTVQEDSAMEMNLDILQKQGSTTTYLGDLYGYQVFSGEFGEAIEKSRAERAADLENSFENVLNNEPEPVIDRAFEAVITGEAQVVIKAEYNTDKGRANTGAVIGCVLLGMILTAVIWLFIERKRKEKSSRENNNNDYRAYFE